MSQGWQLKNIYLYLVSFVTLMMILFGFIAFSNNVIRVFLPTNYQYYTTLMDIEREYADLGREVPPVKELEELRAERMIGRAAQELAHNRAYRIRDLIGSLAAWLIPIPFYIFHWQKIKNEVFLPAGGESIQ